ncbi:hypothetical protein JTB14_020374 [Gonioctena quinquepunctata]|nr:hypothetical protein JTB14_020374 [Gonioctena quinquepunctata]
MEENLEDNSKYFWSYLNNEKGDKSLPTQMHFNDTVATEPTDECKLFSSYFHGVCKSADVKASIQLSDTQRHIDIHHREKSQIMKILEKLDPKKGSGPDEIPTLFMGNCHTSLAEPLYMLYNKYREIEEYSLEDRSSYTGVEIRK